MQEQLLIHGQRYMAPLTQEPFLGEKENVDPKGNFSDPYLVFIFQIILLALNSTKLTLSSDSGRRISKDRNRS